MKGAADSGIIARIPITDGAERDVFEGKVHESRVTSVQSGTER